jgi:hypothetical protein
MIALEEAIRICSPLMLLRGFPWQAEALAAVGRLVQSLVRDESEAIWLVDYMIRHHCEWPGPGALREAYTSRYRPLDADAPSGRCEAHGVTGCWMCGSPDARTRSRVQ